MENKTWKSFKLDFLKFKYEKKAEEWKDCHDDRRIFSNTYYQIIEAIETLPEEPVSYIAVAMNNEIQKDREMLDRIIKRFAQTR